MAGAGISRAPISPMCCDPTTRNKPEYQISIWAVACPWMAGSPRGTSVLQTQSTPAAIAPLQCSGPTEDPSHGTKKSKSHQQHTGYRDKSNTSDGQGCFHTNGMFQTENCLNTRSPHTVPHVTVTTVASVQFTHQAHTAWQHCLPSLTVLSAPLTQSAP